MKLDGWVYALIFFAIIFDIYNILTTNDFGLQILCCLSLIFILALLGYIYLINHYIKINIKVKR